MQGNQDAAHRQWGLTDVELVGSVEARQRFPYLGADIVNARFRQGDGWLEQRRLALELARASGARFDYGVIEYGLIVECDRVRGVYSDGVPVYAVWGVYCAGYVGDIDS